jgi:hypothetical protein
MRALVLILVLGVPLIAQPSGEVVFLGRGMGNCYGNPAGVIGTTGSYETTETRRARYSMETR